MHNLYNYIVDNPGRCERLSCGDSLFTIFNCRLESKFNPIWSHYNYIVYMVQGQKTWHTFNGPYNLSAGKCALIRKGASIVEQFFETNVCFFMFFIPDDFICEVLKTKTTPIVRSGRNYEPVMAIDNSMAVEAYFQSLLPYLDATRRADQSLLELKFKELVLLVADDPANSELLSYFHTLLGGPHSISLQKVMQENFCFNLKLEEFAKLSARSLSAFKRDFIKIFNTSPGKWILEKRLDYALHLLSNAGKTVAEAAFESGFESVSHFSRSFRQRFGKSPAVMKHQTVA